MATKSLTRRERIHLRVRKVVEGTAARPRLAVFRSSKEIYAQVIDDLSGVTLCAASSLKKGGREVSGSKIDQARQVGLKIAELAKAKGIEPIGILDDLCLQGERGDAGGKTVRLDGVGDIIEAAVRPGVGLQPFHGLACGEA